MKKECENRWPYLPHLLAMSFLKQYKEKKFYKKKCCMIIKTLKNDKSNKFYLKIPPAKFAPLRGHICPMDPINPFISVNHVPMEVGTRRFKKCIK